MDIKAISKEKRIIYICGIILIIAFIISLSLMLCSNRVALKFNTVMDSSSSKMKVLNSNAKKSYIAENSYAIYGFTPLQKEEFKRVCEKYGNVSLIVRFQLSPSVKQQDLINAGIDLPFKTGFLKAEDFDKKGKYIWGAYPDQEKITVSGNLKRIWKKFNKTAENSKNASCYFDVSMGIGKKGSYTLPEGFFVYSSVGLNIVSVCAAPAEIGYDFSGSVPYFSFSTNGGVIDTEGSVIDFSGASFIFPVKNTVTLEMPSIILKMSEKEEITSTLDKFYTGKISIGGEKLSVRNVKNGKELVIPAASLKSPFSVATVADESKIFDSILLRSSVNNLSFKNDSNFESNEVYVPIETDPGLILDWNINNWRCKDYEIYSWDRFPGILFFDIRNYKIQDNFFRRLAFYVEKEGYKGRIVSNEELGDKHGYNAHDYSAESLASFFSKCAEINFTLNKEEEILKKILLKNELIYEESDGSYSAGKGGLVSISRETAGWSRTRLLAHEGWHTLFFRNEDFRNFVSAVYYTMDEQSLQFIKDYFASQPSLGYDQSDEYLMHNEFMAYIMQQPLKNVAENFIGYANWNTVTKYAPETSRYIRETKARAYEDAATMMNDFVFDQYGIICGSISLVTRY